LLYKNSAGYVEFARMPPTFAAAKKTYSGFSVLKKSSVSFWLIKLSSD